MPCLVIIWTMKKRANDRRQFSQDVDWKLLLHVELRAMRRAMTSQSEYPRCSLPTAD